MRNIFVERLKVKRIVLLLAVSLVMASAGCGGFRRENREYRHDKAGLQLSYPAGWEVAEQHGAYTAVNFSKKRNGGSLVMRLHGSKDYELLTSEFGFDLFIEKMRLSGIDWNISSQRSVVTNGLDGVEFDMLTGSRKVCGFYLIKNRYEICLSADLESGMLETALNNLHFRDMPVKAAVELQDLDSATNWNNVLEYGRELLQTRDIDVENYHLAQEQFRFVLRTARHHRPVPSEYTEAWHLLEIAKSVQNEAFEEARIRAARHIGMQENKEARKTADFMMDLIGDRHDPRYQEANKLYKKAVR